MMVGVDDVGIGAIGSIGSIGSIAFVQDCHC
jgi:hypothetical protein